MRKISKILFVFVALAMLTACGASGSESKTVKIGVAIYKYDDNFMTVYREQLAKIFEAKNTDSVTYELTFQDGKGDQAEQTNQIDAFISQGMDLIIANLVDPASAATVIDKAKAAEIPVVFINREPAEDDLLIWEGRTAYVGADARQSGTFQGQIILDLETKGDINGDGVVSYVMIVGDPANIDAQYRTEYSIKALTDAGVTVDKLLEQRGDWEQPKGQEIAAGALAQFGDKVEVIFANNDAMALGALQAIESAGRTVGEDIYLVGVDALDEVVTLVNEGRITGTVLNDAEGQATKAVDVALRLLDGESVDTHYWVDYVKVVKEQ
ncbi:galactose ABC transporter substrate-binding protein [Erysipelothrix larvae]|uniref:galactose ABC transporter substrate-binding protein n=1 Tax=Erysipelothrix larvae TaxID=1514105 RepID=UPI00098FE1E4|nr:galactose ABC transporter substrate-binding protein [Erysipelothrix larvae]